MIIDTQKLKNGSQKAGHKNQNFIEYEKDEDYHKTDQKCGYLIVGNRAPESADSRIGGTDQQQAQIPGQERPDIYVIANHQKRNQMHQGKCQCRADQRQGSQEFCHDDVPVGKG